MALTPAEKQRGYRERQAARARTSPDAVESALLEEAARCEQLSPERRMALAEELADLANRHLWRANELSKLADKVRPPGWPPGAPP